MQPPDDNADWPAALPAINKVDQIASRKKFLRNNNLEQLTALNSTASTNQQDKFRNSIPSEETKDPGDRAQRDAIPMIDHR